MWRKIENPRFKGGYDKYVLFDSSLIVTGSYAVIFSEFLCHHEPCIEGTVTMPVLLVSIWKKVSSPGLLSQEITDTHDVQAPPHPPPSPHPHSWPCGKPMVLPPARALRHHHTAVPAGPGPEGAPEGPSRSSSLGLCGVTQQVGLGLLMGLLQNATPWGFFIRLCAVLSALHACYLSHICLSLLMPTHIITGNVELCFRYCSVMLQASPSYTACWIVMRLLV